MYRLLIAWALTISAVAQPTCLVIKHASAARQAFISGANWQYVAGDFPNGMKWKSNITDRYVRKIKSAGGVVVVVNQDYTVDELKQAKETCKAEASK